jgi:hypothetical protein
MPASCQRLICAHAIWNTWIAEQVDQVALLGDRR